MIQPWRRFLPLFWLLLVVGVVSETVEEQALLSFASQLANFEVVRRLHLTFAVETMVS